MAQLTIQDLNGFLELLDMADNPPAFDVYRMFDDMGMPPPGVVLSGPLPAVFCLGYDHNFVVRDDYGDLMVPVYTGENVGGADLIDANTQMQYYHGHSLDFERRTSLSPMDNVATPRGLPQWLLLVWDEVQEFIFPPIQ